MRRSRSWRGAQAIITIVVITVVALMAWGMVRPVAHPGVSAAPLPSRGTPTPPFRCDAVSDKDIVAPVSRIDSGEYTLTMVAAAGSSSGASVRGRLWLRRTQMLDTSSVPTERALVADTARIPLYGAVIIDFGGVGAPVGEGASGAPDPHSFDPLRPGVVVTFHTGRAIGDGRWRLLVGTTANDRRVPCDSVGGCLTLPTTGSGIAMIVRKIQQSGFEGDWSAVAGGDGGARGFFCAVPVHYFGFPYPQRRHIP